MPKLTAAEIHAILERSVTLWFPKSVVQKLHPDMYAMSGWPDTLVIVSGKTYYVEIKTTDYPSQQQQMVAKKIHESGAEYWCLVYFGEKFYILDYISFARFSRKEFTSELKQVASHKGPVIDIREIFKQEEE